MRYDLNLLRVFLALMEERSVTKVAESQGITQPALSNSLNRLREMMRDPLFVRERYGVRPTELAEEWAPIVAEALSKIDNIILGQQDFVPSTATKVFTVAASSYVEFVLLPAVIAKLSRVAPGVAVRLVPYGTDLAESGVVSGKTALVIGRMYDLPGNLVVQHLIDDSLQCVVGKHHPEIGRTLSVEQYQRLKHVIMLRPDWLTDGLHHLLGRHGIQRNIAVSVTHFLAIPDMIAATDYCATLPSLMCRNLRRDNRLKVLPTPRDFGTFPIQMAWHTRYREDPSHKWLRSLVIEAVNEISGTRAHGLP